MIKYYNLEIPISNHLKKYVYYHFSETSFSVNSSMEIILNRKNHISLLILKLIKKEEVNFKTNNSIKYNNKNIEGKLTVLINEKKRKNIIDPTRSFISINENDAKDLDTILEGFFRDELYLYLNSYQMMKGTSRKIKEGLLLFYNKYNLNDEDIAIETLLRDYRRYRKSNNVVIIR